MRSVNHPPILTNGNRPAATSRELRVAEHAALALEHGSAEWAWTAPPLFLMG